MELNLSTVIALIKKYGGGGGACSGENVTVGTTNINCGAIPSNTVIENIPNGELWKKLLIQELAPLTTLTGNPPSIIRERGAETVINFTSKVEKRNSGGNVVLVKFESNPIVADFNFEDTAPNPTLNNYVKNDIKIDNTTIFQVSATDTLGKVGKSTLTYTFVRPTYVGLLDEDINGENITAEAIVENGMKLLQVKGSIPATLTTPVGENRKFFFAYEKTWGDAESIMDVANSFNLIGNCTKVEVDIECLDGEIVTYLCYIANIGGQYTNKSFALNFPKLTRFSNATDGILLTDEANNDKYRLCVDSGNLYIRKVGD